jgi:hypothetical protein
LIDSSSATGLLADNGTCRTDQPMVGGQCQFRDYGPDCLPCTSDDADQGTPENLVETTGLAHAALYDAGTELESVIEGPSARGSELDCDALFANPAGGLPDANLVVVSPDIDAKRIGDNVTSVLTFESSQSP